MARSSKADVRRTLTRRWSGTRLAALWSPSSPCHSDRRRPSGTASSLLTAISSSWSTGSTCSDTSEPRYRVQGRARHRSGWTRYAGRGPRPPTPPGQTSSPARRRQQSQPTYERRSRLSDRGPSDGATGASPATRRSPSRFSASPEGEFREASKKGWALQRMRLCGARIHGAARRPPQQTVIKGSTPARHARVMTNRSPWPVDEEVCRHRHPVAPIASHGVPISVRGPLSTYRAKLQLFEPRLLPR